MLTCDHGPVVQTGGQLCELQACLLAGVGWAQRESARVSALVWLVLWTHRTCRVCSPPPQLRLHTPHSPTDQLEQHNTSRWVNTHNSSITLSDRPAGNYQWHDNCTMIATVKDSLCCLFPSGLCNWFFFRCFKRLQNFELLVGVLIALIALHSFKTYVFGHSQ